jgi:hypothetical protein
MGKANITIHAQKINGLAESDFVRRKRLVWRERASSSQQACGIDLTPPESQSPTSSADSS